MKAFLKSAVLSFFQFIGALLSKFVGWIVNTVLPKIGEGLMELFSNLIEVMIGKKGPGPALFTNGMILIIFGVMINAHMIAAVGFLLWLGFVLRIFNKLGG